MKMLLKIVIIFFIAINSNHLSLAQPSDDPNQYFLQEMIGAAGGSAIGGLLGGSMGFIAGIVLIRTCPEDVQESSTNETLTCSLITSMASTGLGASIGTLAGALVGISILAPNHVEGNLLGVGMGTLIGQVLGGFSPLLMAGMGINLGLIESSLIFITATALGTTLGFNWEAKINPSLRQEISPESNWTFDLPLFDLNF